MEFFVSAVVTLFVVIDPISIVPVFLMLAGGEEPRERRAIGARAAVIAFGVALFFILAGHWLLEYLHLTVHAFAVSGGILLMLMAVQMLFGHRTELQSPDRDDLRPLSDPSVFPLALPMLSGPGAIATLLVFGVRAGGSPSLIGALVAATVLNLVVAWLLMLGSEAIMRLLGERGIHIVTRVMGVILSALAVQFVANGIVGYAGG